MGSQVYIALQVNNVETECALEYNKARVHCYSLWLAFSHKGNHAHASCEGCGTHASILATFTDSAGLCLYYSGKYNSELMSDECLEASIGGVLSVMMI